MHACMQTHTSRHTYTRTHTHTHTSHHTHTYTHTYPADMAESLPPDPFPAKSAPSSLLACFILLLDCPVPGFAPSTSPPVTHPRPCPGRSGSVLRVTAPKFICARERERERVCVYDVRMIVCVCAHTHMFHAPCTAPSIPSGSGVVLLPTAKG